MFDTVLDNFNRANEGPPPSASWTSFWGGVTTASLRVVSNQLKKEATAGFTVGAAYWNAASFGPDVEIAIKYVADVATSDFVALGGRLVNIGSGTTDGYEMDVHRNAATHDWTILRVDDDVTTTLGATFSQLVSANDLIGLRIIGDQVQAWYKPSAGVWTNLAARTDTTYASLGRVGVKIGDVTDQNVTADDFYVQTIPSQVLRPDADTTTTGWTSTPLFSKINEVDADGTIVTATAS